MTYTELAEQFINKEISLDEYVEKYNELINKESDKMIDSDPIPANYKREHT